MADRPRAGGPGWTLLAVGLALAVLVVLGGCLAEEGEGLESGGGGGGPTGVTWAQVNTLFAGPTCQGNCHPPSGFLNTQWLDYNTLIFGSGSCVTNDGKLVEPGDRTRSCIYLAVTKQEGADMLGAHFTAATTDLIGQWIDDGANGP